MSVAREYLERRAIRDALQTYLQAAGWTGLTMSEGYGVDDTTIVEGQVNVLIANSSSEELQLGKTVTSDKIFSRTVQVDCYMEIEQRAGAIADDVMDFMDLTPIYIKDQANTVLGSLTCQDTKTISSRTLPPIAANPNLLKWRSIVRCEYQAHYPNG